jgi:hypothetical protein
MTNETEQTHPAIKHGQGVLQRVEQRKRELSARLSKIQPSESEHSNAAALEGALAAVADLLTGDLDAIREPTASQLNQWLETSQYLCDDKATSDAKVAEEPDHT